LQAEKQLEPVVEGNAGGSLLRLPGFMPCLTSEQQQRVKQLLRQFQESPYTPPVWPEVEQMVGVEVLNVLVEQGLLVKLGEGILFLHETYHDALTQLVMYLKAHGKITVAEARDVLGTTRKYILPLLEHMDILHLTLRRGDERVPGPAAESQVVDDC
jgi:selenocysteine-specific elongation factor